MGTMSLREKAVMAVLAMVALYAAAVALWFFRQEAEWKRSKRNYAKACETYESECKLIREKSKWFQAYEDEKSQMPMFEASKATDTTWLQKLDEVASKHHVSISSRKSGKEVEGGDVYELPIDVSNWEGSLEALVRFMHELENTTEGMFDVRSINFKSNQKNGCLKGSLTLTCAYMREK